MIITVDGPAASGKSTIAWALARHFGLPYLNTGLHYRAVGRQVILNGGAVDSEADALTACDFPIELLEEPDLRSEMVGDLASRVSVYPSVRKVLSERQLAFAHQRNGAVLEGCDMGTVVAPDADAKLYVTASPDVRVQRRFQELLEGEYPIALKEVAADLAVRDERDRSRKETPLHAADDAMLLDTSELEREAAIAEAIRLVEMRLKSR